jgi:hypothetical protein
MQVIKMATGDLGGKVIFVANGTNPLDMLENTNMHARRGKNVALEFDASSARDGAVTLGGQNSGETFNCIHLGLGIQQHKLFGEPPMQKPTRSSECPKHPQLVRVTLGTTGTEGENFNRVV